MENIEKWKLKKLINELSAVVGDGATSCISLYINANERLSDAVQLLQNEEGTAVNIKSRVNRQSVLSALTSTIYFLKSYMVKSPISKNGLAVFCGEGKIFHIELPKPINKSLYMCDKMFHTEHLLTLFNDDDIYGYIIVDGNGYLFGTLAGTYRRVILKATVDLPKKHNKGGQSSVRFGRIREEKRQNYVRKVAEEANRVFLEMSKNSNFKGLIIAGSADFKNVLFASEILDPRIKNLVLRVIDVSYGGDNGFQHAIRQSAQIITNSKFTEETIAIEEFMEEIRKDSGLFCFGEKQLRYAIELGAVKKVIVWEQLDIIEWLSACEYKQSYEIKIVTNCTGLGEQFIQGFGGIGGILRYPIVEEIEEEKEEISDDEDFM